MGRWYLAQLAARAGSQEAVLFDLEIQEAADGSRSGLVIFQAPEIGHYQRLVEAARSRLADLELEYGIGKSKVYSIRATLFVALRPFYQKRDRLRLLIQFRRTFIDRLLSEGEEAAEATAGEYERESTAKDREYESTASALKGKRELNEDETAKLKQLWRKLVRMFHPDQYENDPEKRKTYELLTQAINEARDRGDIELLELIANDPQAFILNQGWASVSIDGSRELKELGALYDFLQARILELIETLDELRASLDYELFQYAEKDAAVINQVVESQRVELVKEIGELDAEAERKKREIEELVGDVVF